MKRIDQLSLAAAHLGKLIGEALLTVGDHVAAGFLFGFLDIHSAALLFGEVLGHLLRDLLVFADQVSRAAEFVPLGMPEEVKQEQFRLSFAQARSPADHLAVQAAHLGRAQHDDAVHRRTVPAFGEQHGIT